MCSVYGARLMVPAGKGLIVIVSSPGGLQHMFNVPYGVGKAAVRTKAQELGRYTAVLTVGTVHSCQSSKTGDFHLSVCPMHRSFLCVALPPSARVGIKCGKMVTETSGLLRRMWAWGILLDSEEGEVGRCPGSHFCLLSLHSVTDWLLTVPMSCGNMESATYLCGQGWCKQNW